MSLANQQTETVSDNQNAGLTKGQHHNLRLAAFKSASVPEEYRAFKMGEVCFVEHSEHPLFLRQIDDNRWVEASCKNHSNEILAPFEAVVYHSLEHRIKRDGMSLWFLPPKDERHVGNYEGTVYVYTGGRRPEKGSPLVRITANMAEQHLRDVRKFWLAGAGPMPTEFITDYDEWEERMGEIEREMRD